MNLSRGFCRLWLVLSAIWISAVFFLTEPHSAYFRLVEARETLGDNDGVITKQELLTAADKAKEDNNEPASQRLRNIANKLDEGKTYETESFVKRERAKSDLKAAALLALIPVSALFLVGFGLLWAFRGFKKNSSVS